MHSDTERWFALNVNPEPWAVGPLDLIRRGGKLAPTMGRNQQLAAYKQAVADELARKYGLDKEAPLPPLYQLDFYFWRNTERANHADATNMQKATEDAMQGVLIGNDRDVYRVRSEVVQQGPDAVGAVVFCVQSGVSRYGLQLPMPSGIPEEILTEVALFRQAPAVIGSDNSWPPK